MVDSQFKKGILELCVLGVLFQEMSYGYEIYKKVSSEMEISESTIYPILRRLVKQGYIDTVKKSSQSGPPRKYYTLSAKGLGYYQSQKKSWRQLTNHVERLIGGKL